MNLILDLGMKIELYILLLKSKNLTSPQGEKLT